MCVMLVRCQYVKGKMCDPQEVMKHDYLTSTSLFIVVVVWRSLHAELHPHGGASEHD